jgi:hypothetical protein
MISEGRASVRSESELGWKRKRTGNPEAGYVLTLGNVGLESVVSVRELHIVQRTVKDGRGRWQDHDESALRFGHRAQGRMIKTRAYV